MRPYALFSTMLLLAVPASAQQHFEGIITMRAGSGNQTMPMKFHTKNGRQAIVATMPAMGGEMRMVIDPGSNQMTMLMPMPAGAPGGNKGMKMVIDIGQQPTSEATPPDISVRRLGTSQTIAGMNCDDYEMVTEGKTVTLCVTPRLGRFSAPSMGARPGSAEMPAWARAFGNRPMFPLKVVDDKGVVVMEVTGIERTAIDEAMFDTNPAGYMTMPAMGGRRN
jgi:hypothetical protein